MTDLMTHLTAHPSAADVSWKLQSRSRDKTKGQLVAYLDGQHYESRLDAAVHSGLLLSWDEETELVGEHGGEVVARCVLTLTPASGAPMRRTGVGAASVTGESGSRASPAKSAATDAFKRACARAGLGRFLYGLPKLWVPLDDKGFPDRAAMGRVPGLTQDMLRDVAGGMAAGDLDAKYAWVLTRLAAQGDELAAARQHLTRIEKQARDAGKGGALATLLREHPDRQRTVEAARDAYRAVSALLKSA